MRSPTIYQNSKGIRGKFGQDCFCNGGFLTMEVMLAFSLFIIFTVATFSLTLSMQKLKIWSVNELDRMKSLSQMIQTRHGTTRLYGNDTMIVANDLFSIAYSDFSEAWGRNNCDSRFSFDINKLTYFAHGVDISASNPSTDIEVRNDIVYLSADSAISSRPDFFIINSVNSQVPYIISSLNTGPGVSALEVAGPYAFLAQSSTVSQLQIVDIRNRSNPQIISQLKLPTPTPTTTAPFATSIFYSKNYIYLGTTKWGGAEFFVINVSDVRAPYVVGSFETNTLINDIYVRGNIAYLANSDEKQLRVLDISNKSSPIAIGFFSPSGWQTQEGKTIEYFEDRWALGRTVGGFNVLANHEAFTFSTNPYFSSGSTSTTSTNTNTTVSTTSISSRDVPGGVYGVLLRPPYTFLLTHSANKELQIYDSALANKTLEMSLNSTPVKMICDNSSIYFATGNDRGFSVLRLGK